MEQAEVIVDIKLFVNFKSIIRVSAFIKLIYESIYIYIIYKVLLLLKYNVRLKTIGKYQFMCFSMKRKLHNF